MMIFPLDHQNYQLSSIITDALAIGDLDKVIWLSNAILAQDETSSDEDVVSAYQAAGVAYGRAAQFSDSAFYFHLCSELESDLGLDSQECRTHQARALKSVDDPAAVLFELQHRIAGWSHTGRAPARCTPIILNTVLLQEVGW